VTVMSDDHVSGDPPEPLRWYTESQPWDHVKRTSDRT